MGEMATSSGGLLDTCERPLCTVLVSHWLAEKWRGATSGDFKTRCRPRIGQPAAFGGSNVLPADESINQGQDSPAQVFSASLKWFGSRVALFLPFRPLASIGAGDASLEIFWRPFATPTATKQRVSPAQHRYLHARLPVLGHWKDLPAPRMDLAVWVP